MHFLKLENKLKIILILFIFGLLFGLIVSIDNELLLIEIEKGKLSKIRVFVNTFTINIWIMFIIWILNNCIINLVITFLKGLSMGISLIYFLKLFGKINFSIFLSYLLYWLIIIPLFIWYIYKTSFDKIKKRNNKYIIVNIIIIALFSLLIAIIN